MKWICDPKYWYEIENYLYNLQTEYVTKIKLQKVQISSTLSLVSIDETEKYSES